MQECLHPVAKHQRLRFVNHLEAHNLMVQMGSAHMKKAQLIFFVRSPIHRFTAGWLSRYRKGAPAHFSPWDREESYAFHRFSTPNKLACALESKNNHTKKEAQWVMHHLQHVSWSLSWFLNGLHTVKSSAKSIAFVGRQEHYEEDYEKLVTMLDESGALKAKPVNHAPHSHENPQQLEHLKWLGRCAVRNLHNWYAEDYKLIRFLAKSGVVDASYPGEVEHMDRLPNKGKKRKF